MPPLARAILHSGILASAQSAIAASLATALAMAMDLGSFLRSGGLGEVVGDLSTGAQLRWGGSVPDGRSGEGFAEEQASASIPTGAAAMTALPKIKVIAEKQ